MTEDAGMSVAVPPEPSVLKYFPRDMLKHPICQSLVSCFAPSNFVVFSLISLFGRWWDKCVGARKQPRLLHVWRGPQVASIRFRDRM